MAEKKFDRNSDARYVKNRKKILATAEICAICGQPLHPELSYPHPLSTTADHIIPIARGGHPNDLDNLQAVHLMCNIKKSDSMPDSTAKDPNDGRKKTISNRILPASMDWTKYRP